MRLPALAVALGLFALPAYAQTNAPASGTTAAPASGTSDPGTSDTSSSGGASHQRRHHRMSQQERFDKANTTHDGHLTKAQAEAAHMRSVASNFDAIDADRKGYVTLDQIRDYRKAQRAARKKAKSSSNG